MATAESVKAQLTALLTQANGTTGKTDANLTAAIASLISGFGQGGLVVGSINLHNSDEDIADTYLENGVETTYNGWFTTGYIPIKADTVYAVKETRYKIDGEFCALYDREKNYMRKYGGGFYSIDDGASLFVGGEGYIRFSGYENAISALSVFECIGRFEFDAEKSEVAVLSDEIPAEMALDILTGGGPEE